MYITTAELKENPTKYLLLSATENIYITKDGETIAKLTNQNRERIDEMRSLFGILPERASLDEAKEERLNKILEKNESRE